ncbi:restriction endonuclease subunit S [Pelatocladus sp. BLCC-F211]|uniref:restriction endonuclease subunit S n=1 Tax=Pelatocladus sp. BLCC-F211 TaxID=3342752 RepID=UPI0035B97F5F
MGKKSRSIPSNWVEKRLGEIATLQRGFDLPTSTRRSGNIPVISSSGFSGTHDTAMVSAPGVVTGRYGTIGEIFWIEEDFWPLNTSLFVKDFHGNYPLFVYYLLQRVDLKKFSDKTGVPGINRNDVHKIKVLLAPIEEQRKIAEILGTWDSAIALTEKLITAQQKRKKALMQSLLSLPGTPTKLKKCLELVIREVSKPTEPYMAVGIRSHGKGTFQRWIENPDNVAIYSKDLYFSLVLFLLVVPDVTGF